MSLLLLKNKCELLLGIADAVCFVFIILAVSFATLALQIACGVAD